MRPVRVTIVCDVNVSQLTLRSEWPLGKGSRRSPCDRSILSGDCAGPTDVHATKVQDLKTPASDCSEVLDVTVIQGRFRILSHNCLLIYNGLKIKN